MDKRKGDIDRLEDDITIPVEEYKELLIIKGRYEELKSQQSPINIETTAIKKIPITPYKVTCSE